MIILAFTYYNFYVRKYSQEIYTLKIRKQQLEDELNILSSQLIVYKKEENTKLNLSSEELNKRLPPNQDQMFTLLDLQRLAQQFNVEISDYSISQKQKLNNSFGNEFDDIFYFSSHQTWRMKYEDFKKLFEMQKFFYPLYSIDSFTLINSEDKIVADFEIKFYGYEDRFAKKRELSFPNIVTGKNNIFK